MAKQCPYRKDHEWGQPKAGDTVLYCRHCYAPDEQPIASCGPSTDPWPLQGKISYTRGGKEFAYWDQGRRHEHKQGLPCNLDCTPPGVQPPIKP
jgi:hypothetical protein